MAQAISAHSCFLGNFSPRTPALWLILVSGVVGLARLFHDLAVISLKIKPITPMPTYDYICLSCGYEWELFQSMKDDPVKVCPSCKKQKAKRLLGLGAGLIFRGTGFYETDYKKKSNHQQKEGSTDSAEPKSSGTNSTDPPPSSNSSSKKSDKKSKTTKKKGKV